MSAEVRLQAISPKQSFLVQAPAGSGKTELLTQRILALLAIVQEPEDILALTFTKKAAAEMRERVIDALNMPKPNHHAPHRMHTWELAQQALQHAQEKQWQLLENPNRLRIMTIDSLTHMLAKQLPLLSGFGDMPCPSDFPKTLYMQAAEDTLNQALKKYPQASETLLLHQDHQTQNVIVLLADMLSHRDQWLQYIAEYARDTKALRIFLEGNLEQYINHQLLVCNQTMPPLLQETLIDLLDFSSKHGGSDVFENMRTWPSADTSNITVWKNIANLLFIKDGNLRKKVTKNQGFPADFKDKKAAMIEILEQLSANAKCIEAWKRIKDLPDAATFSDEQWAVLEALFTWLPLTSSALQRIFQQKNTADYTEISLRALQALSDTYGNPSDVLLKLDYRIQHILIDEFQDTSELQIQLLRCLTTGWQQDDGRTLFMVGDPMQSIYRFRKAEVGLFLQAADNQLPLPPINMLTLERNFRSSPTLTHWVNCAFAQIFPHASDPLSSAIAYTPAKAACTHEGNVCLYTQMEQDDELEAQYIVPIVQQALAQKKRVGILARARKHLHTIIPTLEGAGIAFRAIQILPLHSQPEVRILRALTRALLHPADKLSWASLLRAPCCGLNNQQLFQCLNSKHQDHTIWEMMHDDAHLNTLEKDILSRINHLKQALAPCMESITHTPIRQCVETAWHRLGMPQLLAANAHTNVETVLSLLEDLEAECIRGHIQFSHFDARLEKLYAAPNNSSQAMHVELLTIHGSKGLQWDTVIIPGMGKPPKSNDVPLLAFTEAPIKQGLFLLSPKPQLRSQDTLFNFIYQIEKEKSAYELRRLLYVACTRAETNLHMFGHLSAEGKSKSNSPLHMLLEHDEQCFGASMIQLEDNQTTSEKQNPKLQRIQKIPAIQAPHIANKPIHKHTFAWAGAEAAPIGNVLHSIFQLIAEVGIESWKHENNHSYIRHLLMREGLSGSLLEHAMTRCEKGLQQACDSERARWILSNKHAGAKCEWAVSHQQGEHIMHLVIDRSFEDEHGVRWIIDYKTASHEGGQIDAFLDNEQQRHQAQLERYALALHAMGHHNLRLALYFPMLDAWREWDAPVLDGYQGASS